MVSVDGNLYSVPDTTRRRAVEVHSLAHVPPSYPDPPASAGKRGKLVTY
jgi:hypothetical protein